MFVLGNVLIGLGQVVGMVLSVYVFVLLGRAVCSWVSADPRNTIVRFLYMATEPPLRFVRRLLPMGLRHFPLDIAFLVLFAIVIFLQYALAKTLVDLGVRLSGPNFR